MVETHDFANGDNRLLRERDPDSKGKYKKNVDEVVQRLSDIALGHEEVTSVTVENSRPLPAPDYTKEGGTS